MIAIGQRVEWSYHGEGRSRRKACAPSTPTAVVRALGKATAHIEYRRRDGKLARRHIKLARLS